MAVPLLLSEDHKVLESEFCSGYIDAFGKWNTGFFCPVASDKSGPLFCCGVSTFKYCCTGEARNSTGQDNEDESLLLLVAATLGIAAGISLLTLIACFVCPGCLLHNKRRSDGLPYSGSTVYANGCSTGNVALTGGGGARISIGRCFQPFRNLYSLSGPLMCTTTSWVNQQQSNQRSYISYSQRQQQCATEIDIQCGDVATEPCSTTVFTIPRSNDQTRAFPVPVPVPVAADDPENSWSARSTIGRVPNMTSKFTMSTLI